MRTDVRLADSNVMLGQPTAILNCNCSSGGIFEEVNFARSASTVALFAVLAFQSWGSTICTNPIRILQEFADPLQRKDFCDHTDFSDNNVLEGIELSG